MKISGTKVSSLKTDREITDRTGILYHGATDRIWLYDREDGIDARHYAWPAVWIEKEGRIGEAAVAEKEIKRVRSAEPLPITTRPIKLGDPFAVKKIEEIEAAWPDGSLWPLKVYGAMRLGKWYFLGLARKGRMRMRGSGWRYYKIETFAAPAGDEGLLPIVRISVP